MTTFTTFEEWDGDIDGQPIVFDQDSMREIWRDWKAEREKLIGALAQLLVFEDDHDAAGTEWYDNQKLAVEHAHAVLAEVKEKV